MKSIFVFGSNLAGHHGAGAALEALQRGFPAGLGVGFHPMCYALPTKDETIRTLPLWRIELYVDAFAYWAQDQLYARPGIAIDITRVGCGLAGYHDMDIAPMFDVVARLPNCRFDTKWQRYLPHGAHYWGTHEEKVT